jgi:hypothetical protein
MARRHSDLRADLCLLAEILLCLSLFGPQPVTWLRVVDLVAPAAQPLSRGLAILAASTTSIVVTLALARGIDGKRRAWRQRAGKPQPGEVLEPLLVTLTIVFASLILTSVLVIQGAGIPYALP